MLNGKFYTGLTPKMLDRNTVTQNRLESHLFWPDDTQKDTPHEARIKRRSSFQNETPQFGNNSIQMQASWSNGGNEVGQSDVDTKQRFHKEFAKSSIKFFDNIPEENGDNVNRRGTANGRKNLKQDIAIKPTAMKMQLPKNDTAHDEYAAIKKKQAFSSKIQFFDFVEDGGNNEQQRLQNNNNIKPKMDMNDKKEVERHTKNSPKLQVKGIERNLRLVDEQRNNDVGRYYEQQYNNDDSSNSQNLRNDMRAEPKTRRNNNISYNRTRYESPQRRQSYYDNDDYEYNERRAMPRAQSVPKKILKNPIKDERDYNEDYNGFKNDLEYVEENTRNMHLRNSPKKHVSYDEEVYEYEMNNGYDEGQKDERDNKRDRNERNNMRDRGERNTMRNNIRERDERNNMREREENINLRTRDSSNNIRDHDVDGNYQEHHEETSATYKSSARNGAITAAHSTKNELKTINRQTTGNNQSRREQNEEQQYNESKNRKPWNYNNNEKYNTKLNNNDIQQQQQQRRNTPKMSLSLKQTISSTSSSTPTNDTLTSPTSPTTDSQKHLRSSLCFHGGEIVANNNREGTPTSESNSRQRTARSAATNGRVCVGLPD